MIFRAKAPIFQDITAGYHPTAMMLDQGFSIHHEAHKGHEERTTGFQHAVLFLRALRVLRGGVLRMKYHQRETLH